MRALKLTFALAGLLALLRYVPVYYHTSEFNDFVKQETQRTRLKGQLKSALLNKAKEYSLPVQEDDIDITITGAVLRVAVDYRVPIDLLVYSPKLKFRAIGAGFLRQ